MPAPVVVDDAPRQVAPLVPEVVGDSRDAASDAAGRYIVFSSDAADLPGAPGGGQRNVYRLDTQTGETILIGVDTTGAAVDGDVIEPAISGDGQLLLFVAPDAGMGAVLGESKSARRQRQKAGGFGVYLRNLLTGTTTATTVRLGSALAGGVGTRPQIAPGGTAVVFTAPHPQGAPQTEVFRVPLARSGDSVQPESISNPCITCKALDAAGQISSEDTLGNSRNPTVSADGQWVAYETEAKNVQLAVAAPCPDSRSDIVLRHMLTGQLLRPSAPAAGARCGQAGSGSSQPRLDYSGRRLVFESDQPLKPGLPVDHATQEVYLFDRSVPAPARLSETPGGENANAASRQPSISGDGHTVAFVTAATNLDPTQTDSNEAPDLIVKSLRDGALQRLAQTTTGAQTDGASLRPALNYTGSKLLFESDASNLRTEPATAGQLNVFERSNPLNRGVVFGNGFE